MSGSEQLAWERENRTRYALAAFASGLGSLVSVVITLAFVGRGGGNERTGLIRIHEHQAQLLISLAAQAVAVFFLMAALYYLVRGIVARRPEQLRFLWPLLVAAPVVLTIGAVLTQINLGDLADEFVSKGAQTNARAKDLVADRNKASGILASAGTLILALSYVLVSVNAMRAGLLSRFMGVLGIVSGALLILPLLPGGGSVVQLFWVVALGLLYLDRWPNGRGPAWEVAEAVPWPTAAEQREPRSEPPPTDPVVPAEERAAQPTQAARRQRSRKKKKRRR